MTAVVTFLNAALSTLVFITILGMLAKGIGTSVVRQLAVPGGSRCARPSGRRGSTGGIRASAVTGLRLVIKSCVSGMPARGWELDLHRVLPFCGS